MKAGAKGGRRLRCTVCTHAERGAIDRALVGGESERSTAARWKLAPSSVHRHKAEHIRSAVERAERAANVAEAHHGAATIDQVRGLVARVLALLEVAEGKAPATVGGKAGKAAGEAPRAVDLKAAASLARAAMAGLETQAKLRGEIKTGGGDVNVLVDQRGKPREEWSELTAILFAALRPYPDAARAVAAALSGAARERPAEIVADVPPMEIEST